MSRFILTLAVASIGTLGVPLQVSAHDDRFPYRNIYDQNPYFCNSGNYYYNPYYCPPQFYPPSPYCPSGGCGALPQFPSRDRIAPVQPFFPPAPNVNGPQFGQPPVTPPVGQLDPQVRPMPAPQQPGIGRFVPRAPARPGPQVPLPRIAAPTQPGNVAVAPTPTPPVQPLRYGGQKTCPVTGQKLGSHGTPIRLTVQGRAIYVCCQGCVDSVKDDPQTYLRKVQQEINGG